MDHRVLVSVIIPTKNRAPVVSRALSSVLNQSYPRFEVIIVDDGSDDIAELTEVINQHADPRVKLLRVDKVINAAYARNFGAQQSTGQYIAFLDSDDEWLPTHLSECLNFIPHGECQFGTFIAKYGDEELPIDFNYNDRDGRFVDKLFVSRSIDFRTSTLFFRKSLFDNVKFDDRLQKHQDWGLAVDISSQNSLVMRKIPTVVIHYGHSDQMSSRVDTKASQHFAQSKLSGCPKWEFLASRMMDEIKIGSFWGFQSHLALFNEEPKNLRMLTQFKLFVFRVCIKRPSAFYTARYFLKFYGLLKQRIYNLADISSKRVK